MKAQVFSWGDPSVGIWGNQGEIDIGINVADDERHDCIVTLDILRSKM